METLISGGRFPPRYREDERTTARNDEQTGYRTITDEPGRANTRAEHPALTMAGHGHDTAGRADDGWTW